MVYKDEHRSTYERVMQMHPLTKKEWISNVLVYGLACTCKSGYCAKHDPKIQKLLEESKTTQEEE